MTDSSFTNIHSADTSTTTSGHVLQGVRARWYDIGNAVFGVPLITRAHVNLISIRPGESLLDIGCGTGEVLRQLHRDCGEVVTLHGIDPSDDILCVARRKLRRALNARVELGTGERLRFASASFDWVVSSLTFHHLPFHSKRAAMREAFRVLKPGGRLLLSDFGKPINFVGTIFSALWSWHAFTSENLSDGLRELIHAAGFSELSSSVQGGIIHHTLAQKQVTAD